VPSALAPAGPPHLVPFAPAGRRQPGPRGAGLDLLAGPRVLRAAA